jgi:hypothetical protein
MNVNIKMYKTVILPVVLYGCETWSLTLREEHRLRGFENTVLKGIFGSMGKEVVRGWRRLHNEELHDLYASPNIIRAIKSGGGGGEMGGECSMHGRDVKRIQNFSGEI